MLLTNSFWHTWTLASALTLLVNAVLLVVILKELRYVSNGLRELRERLSLPTLAELKMEIEAARARLQR